MASEGDEEAERGTAESRCQCGNSMEWQRARPQLQRHSGNARGPSHDQPNACLMLPPASGSTRRSGAVHQCKPTGRSNPSKLTKPGCIRSCCDSGDIPVSSNSRTRVSATVGGFVDHAQAISPAGPKRGETGPCRASESQPTKCKRQCGSISCDGTDVNGSKAISSRTAHCFCVCRRFFCVCFPLSLLKTSRHATPRMAAVRYSFWICACAQGGQGRSQRSGQLLTVQVPWALGVQVSPNPPLRSLPVLFPRSSSRAARPRSLSPRQWERSRSWKQRSQPSGRTVHTPRVSTKPSGLPEPGASCPSCRAGGVVQEVLGTGKCTRRRWSRESGDSLNSRPKRQNLRKCHRCQNCSVRSTH